MTSGTAGNGAPRNCANVPSIVCKVTQHRRRCSLESAPFHVTASMSHDPSPPLPSDRSFGTLFVFVFGLLAAWGWWKGWAAASWLGGLCALTGVVTLARPTLLRPFNKAWMALAELLNRVVSPVVLGVIYFGLFTPIAFGMRLAGRDALNRRTVPAATTYWIGREPPGPDPQSLPNQF